MKDFCLCLLYVNYFLLNWTITLASYSPFYVDISWYEGHSWGCVDFTVDFILSHRATPSLN